MPRVPEHFFDKSCEIPENARRIERWLRPKRHVAAEPA
jgi:hypothetical protein